MKDPKELLSKYICPIPFRYTELTVNKQVLCCSEWLEGDIGSVSDIQTNWNSEHANNVRDSILDGSYKYCSTTKCPHLNTLIKTGKPTYGLIERSKFNLTKESWEEGPREVKIVFDSACNLACPSCRVDFIRNDEAIYNKSKSILNKLKQNYSNSIEKLHMSGYGDPFYSTALFEFMTEFKPSWLPNLQSIHLHTNALLWNPTNWEKIKNVHSYIKSCEISIDAATKDTYKVVRKGGNFDLLLRNLEFIDSLSTLKDITISFVVQKKNYTEIVDFYNLIRSIFKSKPNIKFHYYRILNWGVLSDEEFNSSAVWQSTHPEYDDYCLYIDKLKNINDPNVIFNM